MPRNTRRQWPPNVLRRVTPVEPPPSLVREIVTEVIVPALSCAVAMAIVAVWVL